MPERTPRCQVSHSTSRLRLAECIICTPANLRSSPTHSEHIHTADAPIHDTAAVPTCFALHISDNKQVVQGCMITFVISCCASALCKALLAACSACPEPRCCCCFMRCGTAVAPAHAAYEQQAAQTLDDGWQHKQAMSYSRQVNKQPWNGVHATVRSHLVETPHTHSLYSTEHKMAENPSPCRMSITICFLHVLMIQKQTAAHHLAMCWMMESASCRAVKFLP
jgi:hypothetical protein